MVKDIFTKLKKDYFTLKKIAMFPTFPKLFISFKKYMTKIWVKNQVFLKYLRRKCFENEKGFG